MERAPGSKEMLVRHAAVLLPLVEDHGVYSLLYEVRAYDLDVQPGDVCFPGGAVEENETAKETVLREAEEELFIDRAQIKLLHTLPEVNGPGAVVTPFVGLLQDYQGTFSEDEVDHTFLVPVKWLKDHPPDSYDVFYQATLPDDFPYEKIYGGKNYPFRYKGSDICFYDIPKDMRRVFGAPSEANGLPVLWGFTARLTRFFVSQDPRPDMPRLW